MEEEQNLTATRTGASIHLKRPPRPGLQHAIGIAGSNSEGIITAAAIYDYAFGASFAKRLLAS